MIAADYAVSEVNLGLDGPDAEEVRRTRPETILAALEHLDTTYGGAAAYLRDACGLSDAELDGLRRRLISPAG